MSSEQTDLELLGNSIDSQPSSDYHLTTGTSMGATMMFLNPSVYIYDVVLGNIAGDLR